LDALGNGDHHQGRTGTVRPRRLVQLHLEVDLVVGVRRERGLAHAGPDLVLGHRALCRSRGRGVPGSQGDRRTDLRLVPTPDPHQVAVGLEPGYVRVDEAVAPRGLVGVHEEHVVAGPGWVLAIVDGHSGNYLPVLGEEVDGVERPLLCLVLPAAVVHRARVGRLTGRLVRRGWAPEAPAARRRVRRRTR